MKKSFFLAALIIISVAASAQTFSSASQSAVLNLSNAIDISLVTSNTLNMSFTTVNDYANGVESDQQNLLIRSNKKFNVRVKIQSTNFSYSGSSSNPNMNAANVLKMKVIANNTGGSVGTGFTSYKSLSTSGAKIINNATAGGNNTFSVKYFANPGFSYPAGTYSVDVVYTATQA